MTLVGNWRKSLSNKGFGRAILSDLSKTFNALKQGLLIAKLHAFGFQYDALKLLHSYITKWRHRTKVNMSFSSWEKFIKTFLHGSVLGSLFINLYLNDIFYLADYTEVCNFADYATLHACED